MGPNWSVYFSKNVNNVFELNSKLIIYMRFERFSSRIVKIILPSISVRQHSNNFLNIIKKYY